MSVCNSIHPKHHCCVPCYHPVQISSMHTLEYIAGMHSVHSVSHVCCSVCCCILMLQPPRSSFNNGHSTNNDDINLDQSMQSLSNATAGRPVYFDAPTTAQLSSSLSMMKGLQVLRIAAPATMPAAIGGLTQLKQLRYAVMHRQGYFLVRPLVRPRLYACSISRRLHLAMNVRAWVCISQQHDVDAAYRYSIAIPLVACPFPAYSTL